MTQTTPPESAAVEPPEPAMQAFSIYSLATGLLLRGGVMAAAHVHHQVQPGEGIYLGTAPLGSRFVDGEPQPDPQYLLKRAISEVEIERERRTTAPLEFDGITVDADTRAQANISAKLQEIGQARALDISMPAALLVWRDAANTTHEFPDLDAYAAWLGGVAVAITRRGTEAYMWAWEQKAALAGQAEEA